MKTHVTDSVIKCNEELILDKIRMLVPYVEDIKDKQRFLESSKIFYNKKFDELN